MVRVWTPDQNNWSALRSALLARMLGALENAGISIPFNQLEGDLRQVAQAAALPAHAGKT